MLENKKIRDFYNSIVSGKFAGDYEFRRWFVNPRLRADFFMNYVSIKFHLQKVDFRNCLEVGPGPGTWTRILYRHNPDADFDLVDISREMEHQFHLEMRGGANIKYHVQDIMSFNTPKNYDLFFSSRAIEYLDNKDKFLRKIFALINTGGKGIIITKNPDYKKYKRWYSFDSRFQHQGQISTMEISKLLERSGFSNIKVYPVIIRLPIIDRLTTLASEWVFKKVVSREMSSKLLLWFTESYVVTFKKI